MEMTQLYPMIEAAFAGHRPPIHVVRRLHALVEGAEAVYVEASVRPADKGLDGWVVAFTASQVALVEFTGATNPGAHDPNAFTSRASAWGRGSLEHVSITPDEDDALNTDNVWQGDWQDRWPDGAALSLTYRAGGPVVLTGEASRTQWQQMRALLPSLLADLDTR